MKKNIVLGIIIAILLICVAVEGFFLWKQSSDKSKGEDVEQVQETVESPSPTSITKQKELPKNKTMDGEDLKISKRYSSPKEDELVYTYLTINIEEKMNNGYKYEVPQINLESKEVEKINKEILKKYEDIIDEINEEQMIDFACEGLSYEYYENDGILSLVMINPTEDGGFFTCNTYNIDVSSEKTIDNEELLEKVDITEKDLSKKIVNAIENSKLYKDIEGVEEFVKQQRDNTINKYKNISIDEITLYVNNEEHICAYMEVYALAGGDTMTIILDLETNEIVEMR